MANFYSNETGIVENASLCNGVKYFFKDHLYLYEFLFLLVFLQFLEIYSVLKGFANTLWKKIILQKRIHPIEHAILAVEKLVFCYQNCSDLLWEKKILVIEEKFEIRGWRPRICKIFEITRTIYSNSERSEQFLVTECFFNLFLEVSQI